MRRASQAARGWADRLLHQARLALDDDLRLRVVGRMYALRLGEDAPARRSVEPPRGIEGARMRKMYKGLAARHGVAWDGRSCDPAAWDTASTVNRCLSAATSALYGLSKAAVLASGHAPALGFLHTGKPQSVVHDIADLFRFATVVPEAFRVAAAAKAGCLWEGRPVVDAVAETRRCCRDAFAARTC